MRKATIVAIMIAILYLIVETQLLDSVIEAVYPIVSPFPLGFLGLVLIGLTVLVLTVGKLVDRIR